MAEPTDGFDRKVFWEHKILTWEDGRYQQTNTGAGLLERLADWSSSSLRFRMQVAGELLAPHVEGKHVVDLGCGSGILAPAVIAAGAASYFGVDIAEAAIATARRRAEGTDWGAKSRFEQGGIETLPDVPRDVVVSLGLTDWLDDDELSAMFAWSGDAHFLHALSELRASPTQWVHRAYCYVAYGYRTEGYVPRYFSAEHLPRLARPYQAGPYYVFRDRRLSFGALVSTLPVGPQLSLS